MSSVVRFDLLNYQLTEPVDLNPCQCSAFPMVRRLILFPREQGYPESLLAWPSLEQRDVTAFVEIEGTKDERTLQEMAQDFMAWVCWLISLAELHHVYYWGSHHYTRDDSTWKLRSSAWKATTVKDWKPSMPDIFEGTVLYWRLPDFLSRGLKSFSEPEFGKDDFVLALHLLLDSLPRDQLSEMRFIKKWIAFEKLVNEQAMEEGYAYAFGRAKSSEFDALRKSLAEVIEADPSVRTTNYAKDALMRQLNALERAPIKTLARRFLGNLSIPYDEKDIDRMTDTRNGILHYIETRTTAQELWRRDQILMRLVSQILCKKIEWDQEKELHQDYAPPYREPSPEYVKLHEEKFVLGAEGSGSLETEDQTCTIECKGRVDWNRDGVHGQLVTQNTEMIKIFDVHNSLKSVRIHLATANGESVLVDRGKISRLEMHLGSQTHDAPSQSAWIPFNVFALKVLVEKGS